MTFSTLKRQNCCSLYWQTVNIEKFALIGTQRMSERHVNYSSFVQYKYKKRAITSPTDRATKQTDPKKSQIITTPKRLPISILPYESITSLAI